MLTVNEVRDHILGSLGLDNPDHDEIVQALENLAGLSKDREIPTLVDCGCKTKVHTDGCGVEVYFCDLHGAAEKMQDTLLKVASFAKLTEVIEALEESGMDEAAIRRAINKESQ